MPSLTSKLNKAMKDRQKIVWRGPCDDGPNGGISQSMLNKFLVCRHRFYVEYVLGLQTLPTFNKNLEYGNFWHICEEGLAAGESKVFAPLEKYEQKLFKKYPLQKDEIHHWVTICKLQFPLYAQWWEEHEDEVDREPVFQEHTFKVPYDLNNDADGGSYVVYLRGKADQGDNIRGEFWIKENKATGDLDREKFERRLMFDNQTLLYATAITEDPTLRLPPLAGIRYNVIKRPLSGGKGTIKQKKNQSLDEYHLELYEKMKGAIGMEWGMPPGEHFYFQRWTLPLTSEDLQVYQRRVLDPVLKVLCDWYEWVTSDAADGDPFAFNGGGGLHWQMPFGVYSPLLDVRVGNTSYDQYLLDGNSVGLTKVDSLFPELQEED